VIFEFSCIVLRRGGIGGGAFPGEGLSPPGLKLLNKYESQFRLLCNGVGGGCQISLMFYNC